MNDETSSFNMRLPSELRKRLGALASANNRSVNAEVVGRLTRSLEGGHSRGVFEALQLPRVVRLHTTSSSADVDRLVTICTELDADLVIFGARRDALDDAVLVMIARTPSLTCLMDTGTLSLARRPRVLEVQKLFRALDALGLLHAAQSFAEFIEDSTDMDPLQAVDHLVRQPRRRLDVAEFLAKLGHGQSFDEADFRLPVSEGDRVPAAATGVGAMGTRNPDERARTTGHGFDRG